MYQCRRFYSLHNTRGGACNFEASSLVMIHASLRTGNVFSINRPLFDSMSVVSIIPFVVLVMVLFPILVVLCSWNSCFGSRRFFFSFCFLLGLIFFHDEASFPTYHCVMTDEATCVCSGNLARCVYIFLPSRLDRDIRFLARSVFYFSFLVSMFEEDNYLLLLKKFANLWNDLF